MAQQSSTSPEASDLKRLFLFIGVSVIIHVVILVVTSLPYIMRGFKPAGTPAAAAAPATTAPSASPTTAPPTEKTPTKTESNDTSAVVPAKKSTAQAANGKTTKTAAADPDATYFKDDKLTPADLRKGPDLDTGLDSK